MFARHNLKVSVTVFVKKKFHIEYVDTYVDTDVESYN
jgi:hypothetical protein